MGKNVYNALFQKREVLHVLWRTISRHNVQYNNAKKNVILHSEHHNSMHGYILPYRSHILSTFGQRWKGNKLFYSIVKFEQSSSKLVRAAHRKKSVNFRSCQAILLMTEPGRNAAKFMKDNGSSRFIKIVPFMNPI